MHVSLPRDFFFFAIDFPMDVCLFKGTHPHAMIVQMLVLVLLFSIGHIFEFQFALFHHITLFFWPKEMHD